MVLEVEVGWGIVEFGDVLTATEDDCLGFGAIDFDFPDVGPGGDLVAVGL